MTTFLIIAGLAGFSFHIYRQYWTHRALPRVHSTLFDGELIQVGSTSIAIKRPAAGAKRTLVCFPGFLEDVRYFLSLHSSAGSEGSECELILINNANYHSPFESDGVKTQNWGSNPFSPGTIEYDGFHVAKAVELLATTNDIVIHGHSRGGAVVLDAGRQFPEIMNDDSKRIAALLEAAVLPQGTQATGNPNPLLAAITLYLMPVFLGLSRKISDAWLQKLPMMNPTNEVKTNLLRTLFCNTKDYAICVENARNIVEWEEQHLYDLYENYREITLLIGERDDVLSNTTMMASAQEGVKVNSGVKIVQTTETNHFISLETPEVIYDVLAQKSAS